MPDLIPVDNDPYAVNLMPVKNDPYAVNLIPVDYQPDFGDQILPDLINEKN
jgi:hypothetical protein